MKRTGQWIVACILLMTAAGWSTETYRYVRAGNAQDITTQTTFGIAMMGGGDDLDEAFRWLCGKGNGGDFLVLRARGDDDYNPYVKGLCRMNSVATLIIPDREAAENPAVAEIIRKAEVVFISGGDQANYIRGWKGTAVQKAINEHIAAGKPIGGTSAGLAVQGEFAYGALNDMPEEHDLASSDVLPNPYHWRVTIERDFLEIPLLTGVITDSHFAKRDRMGRSLGFLARIMKEGWNAAPREIAIDEKSAALVDADGSAKIVGMGKGVYFMRPTKAPEVCEKGVPLTLREIEVQRVRAGSHFDVKAWKSVSGGASYTLSVERGVIGSTQAGNSVY